MCKFSFLQRFNSSSFNDSSSARQRIAYSLIFAIFVFLFGTGRIAAQTTAPLAAAADVVGGVEAVIIGRAAEAFEQFDSNLSAGLPFAGDEVWFVDARESHNFPDDLNSLRVKRLVAENWEPSHFQELIQSHQNDPAKVTLVYSHGDRTDEQYAFQRGLQFYRNIFEECSNSRTPVRLVIWAWKSEKACNRPIRDFSVKSNRSRLVGRTLGLALSQFSDKNMVLVGYSLGAQSMLSALESPALTSNSNPGKYRVCLIAPVMEGCFVSQHRCCSPDKDLVDKSIIFDNRADRALQCSRVLGFRTAPGGQASIQKLALNGNLALNNIAIFDMSNSIGSKHSIVKYSADALVSSGIRELVADVEQEKSQGIARLTPEENTIPKSLPDQDGTTQLK